MKSASQITLTKALTVATTNLDPFDITQFSGLALQVKTPAAAAGTAKLQWSNNGTDWLDVASGSVALAASTSVGVVVAGVYGSLARVVMTVSAGAGNYDIILTAKER